MAELGVDLSGRRPQRLTHELAERADLVVTMGCGDTCPYIPGKRYVDWDLPDPKGRPVDEVRATRDDIQGRVDALLERPALASGMTELSNAIDGSEVTRIGALSP